MDDVGVDIYIVCGYQVLSPTWCRLIITVILQVLCHLGRVSLGLVSLLTPEGVVSP